MRNESYHRQVNEKLFTVLVNFWLRQLLEYKYKVEEANFDLNSVLQNFILNTYDTFTVV